MHIASEPSALVRDRNAQASEVDQAEWRSRTLAPLFRIVPRTKSPDPCGSAALRADGERRRRSACHLQPASQGEATPIALVQHGFSWSRPHVKALFNQKLLES